MQITTIYSFGGYAPPPNMSTNSEIAGATPVTKTTEYAVTVTYDSDRSAALYAATENASSALPTVDDVAEIDTITETLPSERISAEELAFTDFGKEHAFANLADEAGVIPEATDYEDSILPGATAISKEADDALAPSLFGDSGLISISDDAFAAFVEPQDPADENAEALMQIVSMQDAEVGFAAATTFATASAPTSSLMVMM